MKSIRTNPANHAPEGDERKGVNMAADWTRSPQGRSEPGVTMAHLEVIHGALKDAVAEHLRHHPLLPPWAVSADDALSTTAEILLDVEATLLGYWTDIPEAEIQRILPRLREALGKTV